jgi:hypothetical protein
METSMEVPQKIKNRTSKWSKYTTSEIYSKELKPPYSIEIPAYPYYCSSII